MMNDTRTWQAIKRVPSKRKHAKKRVEKSDFRRIREMRLDQEGAGSTSISYELAGMWLGQNVLDGTTFETLEIPGAGNIEIEGAPELPQEGLFVAIPENADITEVRFLSADQEELRCQNLVQPASKPVRAMEEPQYIPNWEIYNSDKLYPGGIPCRLVGTKRIAGRKVAHIMLYPVQYYPRSKRLVVLKSIRLEVRYRKEAGTDRVAPRRILQTAPADRLILDSASQLEAEKERLMSEPHSRNCSNLSDCNNEGQYLIITTDGFEGSVVALVEAAEAKNYIVKVVKKEDILTEFQKPAPEPPHVVIRNFLRYACDNWKKEKTPKWVILAGDTQDIPTHWQMSEEKPHHLLASDHFYADLWDDLAPDLVVSRLPTSKPGEMAEICNNAAVSGGHDPSWANKILFVTYKDSHDQNPDARAECIEQLADQVGDRYQVTKMLSGKGISKDPVIGAINDGIGLINYLGHGWETNWWYGLKNGDVCDLTNGDRRPVVFSIACYNNCIDYNMNSNEEACFGECWIRRGKAVAFLGASRLSFSTPNLAFQRFLFDAIVPQEPDETEEAEELPEPLTQIGDIMNFAKTKLYQNSMGSNQVKDNIRMYLLLGDPCATFGEIK